MHPRRTRSAPPSQSKSQFLGVFAGCLRFGGILRRRRQKRSSTFLAKKKCTPANKILATPMSSAVAERPRRRVCQFGRHISDDPFGYTSVVAEHRTGVSRRCLSLMRLFSVTSANIAISHILLKLDSLGCIFVAYIMGVSSTT